MKAKKKIIDSKNEMIKIKSYNFSGSKASIAVAKLKNKKSCLLQAAERQLATLRLLKSSKSSKMSS